MIRLFRRPQVAGALGAALVYGTAPGLSQILAPAAVLLLLIVGLLLMLRAEVSRMDRLNPTPSLTATAAGPRKVVPQP